MSTVNFKCGESSFSNLLIINEIKLKEFRKMILLARIGQRKDIKQSLSDSALSGPADTCPSVVVSLAGLVVCAINICYLVTL